MSYLERYTRDQKKKESTKVLPSRLPLSLYEAFSEHCARFDLTMSEAVKLLIEHELSATTIDVYKKNTVKHTNKNTKQNTYTNTNTNTDTNTHTNTNTDTNTKPRTGSNTGSFTLNPWKIDGNVPCPLCNKWYSSTNFSRHAKKRHKLSSEVIFTSEEYADKINAMMQEQRQG